MHGSIAHSPGVYTVLPTHMVCTYMYSILGSCDCPFFVVLQNVYFHVLYLQFLKSRGESVAPRDVADKILGKLEVSPYIEKVCIHSVHMHSMHG